MARTKAQVVAFLNSQVGDKVNVKCGIYNGQCVSLIKALLEFLGVPDPYAGRGNAKDVGDTLLRQNIAENGKGTLTVVINKSMGNINGVVYGHIWVDIKDNANYEQNGAVALHTTKNTRPLSQGQQFVNLDKWLGSPAPKVTRKLTWKTRRNYVLTKDTYIASIPDNKKAGTLLHKKGEVLDIREYTKWSNGKSFYRTKKQVADKDMRGYGKSITIKAETAPLKSAVFEK